MTYVPYVPMPPQQFGWVCPKCNRGVAPFMPYCPHCPPSHTITVRDGS